MSTEKRPPTADEIAQLFRELKGPCGHHMAANRAADALEAQADQLKRARKWLQGCVDHGLPPNVPVWREIKAWLAANPAPNNGALDPLASVLAAHPTGLKEVKSERQPAIIEAATEMHRRWVAMINFHDGTGNEAQEVYDAYAAAFAHLTAVCELYRNETLNARAALKGVKSDER